MTQGGVFLFCWTVSHDLVTVCLEVRKWGFFVLGYRNYSFANWQIITYTLTHWNADLEYKDYKNRDL